MFTERRIVVLLLVVGAIAAETKAARTDQYGDPLPEGAIARIGTVRWRLPGLGVDCAFSCDGKVLVAVSDDTSIHVFDAATGRPLRQLHSHKEEVTSLVFSPDGHLLASGSKDGTLCLWEWPSGKVLRQFPAHEQGVRALAFAGSGKFLASGGDDNLVRLWDPVTGRQLRQFKGHKSYVIAVAISPDDRFVASSERSNEGIVHLWDAADGRLLHEHKTHVDWVYSLAFSPDSKLLGLPLKLPRGTLQVALMNVASRKIVRQFSDRMGGWIASIVFSPDGRIVAAGGDRRLVLWDARTGKVLHQRPDNSSLGIAGEISCLAFSPDGRRLAFREGHCLRVWDVGAWREIHPVEGYAKGINRILFSQDSKTLVALANDVTDTIREWDATTGKKLRTLWTQELINGNALQLSPDHRVLTLMEIDKKSLLLRTMKTDTGKEIRHFQVPFNPDGVIASGKIVLSPDAKIITSEAVENGVGTVLLLRDAKSGKVLDKLPGHYDGVTFSNDSAFLAGFTIEQIDLYSLRMGRIIRKLPLEKVNIIPRNLTFSPDSRLVVATRIRPISSFPKEDLKAERLYLWEPTTGKICATFLTSAKCYSSVAFSPDGALLAGGDSEGNIHLWSLSAGKEVRQLRGHRSVIESLAFSHDGKLLASGSGDTTALIWDVRETAEAARPRPADVPRERLEQLWADLGSDDAIRAHQAIWRLVAARQIIPWLQNHLKPVPTADAQRIARLIADLDSDTFAVREKALHELEAIAEAAEPALRKVVANKPSAELCRRVEPILKKLENWPVSSAGTLREWRALEVLEHLGTPEARKLLQRLAEGTPVARLTHEVKAALQRLDARRTLMP